MIKEEIKQIDNEKDEKITSENYVYNFDEVVDRSNTCSIKHNFKKEYQMPEDVIPMWVADTDFKVEPKIIDALTNRIKHGIFGYSALDLDYHDIMANWFKKRFDWEIEKEWLVNTPTVIFALSNAVKAFTKENDAILINDPVYPPFHTVIKFNNRRIVSSDLVNNDGLYQIDFTDFENKIVENSVKMFILCNPHNPIGRVWTMEELKKIDEICQKHKVFVVSDEIHADITFQNKTIIYAQVSEYAKENCIVCTAPSKAFNIAGLQISNIYIPNKKYRQLFQIESEKVGFHGANLAGALASKSAYQHGEAWLDQSLVYYKKNIAWVEKFLKDELPIVKMSRPEGTYLLWLDFRGLNLSHDDLVHFLIYEAKLWLNNGLDFGPQGYCYMRMNIGCSLKVVKQAFKQLKEAIDRIFTK